VDDEPSVAESTRQALIQFGYRVTVRTNSQEALELFAQYPDRFDLVLTDQTMPHMTGEQLAKSVMAIRMDVAIVLVTGFSQTMDEERCRKLGMDCCLTKPLLPGQIARAVREVLVDRRT